MRVNSASTCKMIMPPSGLPIYYKGPDLTKKPLPGLFYFALSGEESLTLDPFNQPINFLLDLPIRIYSFTLPGHEIGQDKMKAMAFWAQQMTHHPNELSAFIDKSLKNIDFLISQGYTDPERLAISGLSRGGFIATLLAAKDLRLRHVLGFAPVTRLSALDEFEYISIAGDFKLDSFLPSLTTKHLRYYIGNRDTRVGTDLCFEFIRALVEAAYQKGIRSPQIELIINPSIGLKGHGTSMAAFREGAGWIKKELQLQDNAERS